MKRLIGTLVLSGAMVAGTVSMTATAAHADPGFRSNCSPNVSTATGGCGGGGSNLNTGGGGFGSGFGGGISSGTGPGGAGFGGTCLTCGPGGTQDTFGSGFAVTPSGHPRQLLIGLAQLEPLAFPPSQQLGHGSP